MTRRNFCSMMLVFATLSAWAIALEPSAEELENQRRKLEQWRTHPEQLARLRQNLQAFLALPTERRDQIIKLDHDLLQEDSIAQARLANVLDRYADWFERLPEKDRQAIRQAKDKSARLDLIRELRDEVWMRSSPKTVRDEWAKLPADARADYVRKLRREARLRNQQWQIASRFWHELESKQTLPSRLSDFSNNVQKYVNDYLSTMLNDAEKKQLALAEGKWPDYPRTLVEIASKHPSALPPDKRDELPMHLAQLPTPIQARITNKKSADVTKKNQVLKKLEKYEGKPEFASKVVELATENGAKPFSYEFWACSFDALLPPMKDFVTNKLKPALKDNPDHLQLLKLSEGKWPAYPEMIQDMSHKYHLHPPWHILPDKEKFKWDSYRPGRQIPSSPPVLTKDKSGG